MSYTIPNQRRGDTWNGIDSITLRISGVYVDLTDAIVRMQFRETVDSPVALTLSTENSAITITEPLSGTVRVEPIYVVDIPFGRYFWDYQITYPNGVTKTYMDGTWTITSDITI
jgi:hypothetical protein